MKRLIVLLLIIIGFTASSQHIVKYLPENLYVNSGTFEWEMHEGRNSLIIGVGVPLNRSIIGRLGVHPNDFKVANFSSESVRAAYRHYTSRTGEYGMYIEPYFKCQTVKTNVEFHDPDNTMLKAYLYTTNVGFQLGYQWVFKSGFVIDLYFIGLEAGRGNGRIHSISRDNQYAIKTEKYIWDNADKYLPGYIKKKLSTSVDGRYVDAELKSFVYPWMRTGVSIGFKF
jgi:hypothetical protein